MNKDRTFHSIPDPLAPESEKKSDAYGLKMAVAIQQEWFINGKLDKHSLFMQRHNWIREMRLYNRGEQDIEKYKNILASNKQQLQLMSMQWTPINIAEKFTNVARSGISDEQYRLDVRSADKFSLIEKHKKRKEHIKNMHSKEMLERVLEMQGIDLRPQGFVPEDMEEMELYNEIKDRPKHEIAEEIAINYVKEVNGWDQIKEDTDKDLVESDIQVARIWTDPHDGIKMEYVDPESYGHSYVERKDFSDAYYHFVIDTVTINQIKNESGFSEKDLREIAKSYASENDYNRDLNFDRCELNQILQFKVYVMRFCYKTDKKAIYKKYLDKKNRTKKVAERDETYQPPEGAENAKLERGMDTWYEGSYIVGSQKYIYNYKECENLLVDELDRAMPPFVVQSSNIYRNKLKSFLSNIIPMCDDLQLITYKIKHLVNKLRPDMQVVNLDALAEINLDVRGESKQANWRTALDIMNVEGIIFERTIDAGEEGTERKQAARPGGQQQGSALINLLNVWATQYNWIRETTGINPAMDGSIAADSLVGTNQIMQLAGNKATRHLVKAATLFDKRICETISSRIKQIFTHKEGKKLQDMYQRAVGKFNLDALESMSNRSMYDFAMSVEFVPSKQEMDELRQDLNIAMQEGFIDISEKARIMDAAKSNIKKAYQYMGYVRRRKIKERMKETEFNNRVQAQNNAAAAQAKAQAELETYKGKKQIDLIYESNSSAIELKKISQELQIKEPHEKERFKEDVYLEQVKTLATINLAKFKEDAKDERQDEANTQQSQMIHQRKADTGPINFKKSFDVNSLFR
jgi:hypothetical protein